MLDLKTEKKKLASQPLLKLAKNREKAQNNRSEAIQIMYADRPHLISLPTTTTSLYTAAADDDVPSSTAFRRPDLPEAAEDGPDGRDWGRDLLDHGGAALVRVEQH
ncbi:hypothetical protein CsSME_00006874 [Camellia sinensis var. sinensis]